MFTRRHFLGLAAASPLAAAARYAPILAGQVYVYTQYLRERKIPLGDGLEEMMAAYAQAGYRTLELVEWFFTPELRARTTELVRRHKFAVPIVYAGQPLHDPARLDASLAAILDTARAVKEIGALWINANPAPKPQKALKTAEELDVQARALNRLADELALLGMKLMVHHHDPEMLEDAREWRHIKDHTDPAKVFFCLDTHWVLRGGQDPYRIVEEALPRLKSIHLRNSINGAWTESLGDGEIDYRRIASILKRARYDGYLVVELAWEAATKRTRPLVENLKLSREYARKVFL